MMASHILKFVDFTDFTESHLVLSENITKLNGELGMGSIKFKRKFLRLTTLYKLNNPGFPQYLFDLTTKDSIFTKI